MATGDRSGWSGKAKSLTIMTSLTRLTSPKIMSGTWYSVERSAGRLIVSRSTHCKTTVITFGNFGHGNHGLANSLALFNLLAFAFHTTCKLICDSWRQTRRGAISWRWTSAVAGYCSTTPIHSLRPSSAISATYRTEHSTGLPRLNFSKHIDIARGRSRLNLKLRIAA